MSEDRLAEIRTRCEAATPGRLRVAHFVYYYATVTDSGEHVGQFENECDALFCAAARDDVPYLLSEIDRLLAEQASFREAIRGIRGDLCDALDVLESTGSLDNVRPDLEAAIIVMNVLGGERGDTPDEWYSMWEATSSE